MSESKHTPGPWRAYGFMITGGDFRQVAECNMPVGTPGREEDATVDEDQANARLIAAAPDLLAACEMLISDPSEEWSQTEFDRRVGAARDMARAAVKKAKGE